MPKDKYDYNINDIVNNFLILEKIDIRNYKIKCLKCGYEFCRDKKHILKKKCGCCSNRITCNGINDIATTNPELIKYFFNKNDSIKYGIGSHEKIDFICPYCNSINKDKVIRMLKNGFNCDFCGNKGSYSERILKNILSNLKKDYFFEKTFKWSQNKRYDFYILLLNCIIETHGIQHYEEVFKDINGRTLEQEQSNDQLKERLAKENGIEHYIVLDCRKSELEWIKNSVLNSELNELFDLSEIDWNNLLYQSNFNIINKIVYFYNRYNISAYEISKMVHITKKDVLNYLKIANKLNLIEYNEITCENMRKNNVSKSIKKHHYKEIICLNDKKIYNSYMEAEKNTGCPHITISKCCRKDGKHYSIDNNGNKLFWMFKEDYENSSDKEILEIMNFQQKYNGGNKKKGELNV